MVETAYDFTNNPEKYFSKLEDKICVYSVRPELELLKKAYYFSFNRHYNQFRDSGEPFASHPYAVANILADLKLDTKSVITALLHDTLEDGVASFHEIERFFGKEILQLVEGVTKLSKIQLPDNEVREANNFRKFILAICKDIRILIIKLADRLHNMRTIKFVKDKNRKDKIAKETLEVYAPLAGRVGFQIMREELEDLAFKELNPIAYQSIAKRILFLSNENKNFVENTIHSIKETLDILDVKVIVSGREKKIYSTWKKMQKKLVSLENLSDIFAFRIITSSIEECYRVLGQIHTKWSMVPEKFKDFISTPKPNGYSSIHTTVIGHKGIKMELQIKSHEMNKIAEYGVASHWIYKNGNGGSKKYDIHTGSKWFQDVLDIIKTAGGPRELIENSKIDMYSDNVFCFTPKGDVIQLIKGSTMLDFAYAIHTSLGNKSIGAKINGDFISLNSEVTNGDQIQIVSSRGQFPQRSWLNFCVTGKAKSQIRKFLRDHEMDEFEKLGKEILRKILLDFNKRATKKTLSFLVDSFNYRNYKSFYVALGRGEINSNLIIKSMNPKIEDSQPHKEKKSTRLPIIGFTKGLALNIAECCNPLPGENIVGIFNEGKGINVHLLNCSTLERFADFPELWHELIWDNKNNQKHYLVSKVKLTIQNRIGSLNKVTNSALRINVNIIDIKIEKRLEDFFELVLAVQVKDYKHLNDLMIALRLEEEVYKITRI